MSDTEVIPQDEAGCAGHPVDVELQEAVRREELAMIPKLGVELIREIDQYLKQTGAQQYFSWSHSGIPHYGYPYDACTPALRSVMVYFARTFGGTVSYGCHNDRAIAGTSTWSSHSWGTAHDILFPSREITVQAMAFLVRFHIVLGINTIHDYTTQRMWKPGYGEDVNTWPQASIGSKGGKWIHVECTPSAFLDSRSVEDKVHGYIPPEPPPEPPPLPPVNFITGQWGLIPLVGSSFAPNTMKPYHQKGSRDITGNMPPGEYVKYAQSVAWHRAGQRFGGISITSAMDGYYGDKTVEAIRNIQHFFRKDLDPNSQKAKDLAFEQYCGILAGATWPIIDFLASKK